MKRLWTVVVLGLSMAALSACAGDGGASDEGDGGAGDTGIVDPAVVTARIGAAGGTLVSSDGAFELRIPAAALSEETEIVIRTLAATAWPSETSDAPPLGAVYELLPEGLIFTAPAQVVHRVSAAALTGGGSAYGAATHISRSSAGAIDRWPTATTYRRTGAAAVVGEVTHFSTHWATLASPAGALSFTVEQAPKEQVVSSGPFGITSLIVDSDQPGTHEMGLLAGVYTTEPTLIPPNVPMGWTFGTGAGPVASFLSADAEAEVLPGSYARMDAPLAVVFDGGLAQPVEMVDYPGFMCGAEVGFGLVWYELTLDPYGLTVLIEGEFDCIVG